MEFHERLKELRVERAIRQKQLGIILDYGYTAISNYERGRNEPSIADLKKIAEYFDVSLDYLLGVSNLRRRYNEKTGPQLMRKFEEIYYSSNSETKQLLKTMVDLIYQLQENHQE